MEKMAPIVVLKWWVAVQKCVMGLNNNVVLHKCRNCLGLTAGILV